jgi:DHA2 family multidrug resistance protein-like MFS transporter
VIGSIAASLYGNRLGQTIPHGLPVQAAHTARGSLGGALVAAQQLRHSGLAIPAHHLTDAAVGAFLHSFSGGLKVAGAIAFAGAVIAAVLLPARPGTAADADAPVGDGSPADALREPALAPIAAGAALLDEETVGACSLGASNPAG